MKYCKNCKYLGYYEAEMGEFHYLCYHPSNVIIQRNAIHQYKTLQNSPEAKNKNNDCLSYKKKWYIFKREE